MERHDRIMEAGRRWAYALTAVIAAGVITLGFFAIFARHSALLSLLPWLLYSCGLAGGFALILWPGAGSHTQQRMILTGLAIPTFVIAILSLTFGFQNPGLPGCMDCGIEASISETLELGLLMFIVFSCLTGFTPYILGSLLSLMFTKPPGG